MSLVSFYDNPLLYENIETTPTKGLAPVGSIVSRNFPDSAQVGVIEPWDVTIRNSGTTGRIGFGVVNNAGNPGNMVFSWQGEETIISPGIYFRIETIESVPNGFEMALSGSVRFEVAGSYAIRIWGMHEEAGTWYYDEEIPITVTVSTGNGNGAVTIPVHIFDNKKLKAEWFDISKSMTRSITNIDTSVLVGGKLEYTVKYTQGMPIAETANIAFDGTTIVSERLSKGEAKSGIIDLTGSIGNSANITISFESSPGIWSEVLFDIWVSFDFSEEPEEDPDTPSNWEELIGQYKWYIIGGVAVLTLFYMSRKQSIIVVK